MCEPLCPGREVRRRNRPSLFCTAIIRKPMAVVKRKNGIFSKISGRSRTVGAWYAPGRRGTGLPGGGMREAGGPGPPFPFNYPPAGDDFAQMTKIIWACCKMNHFAARPWNPDYSVATTAAQRGQRPSALAWVVCIQQRGHFVPGASETWISRPGKFVPGLTIAFSLPA